MRGRRGLLGVSPRFLLERKAPANVCDFHVDQIRHATQARDKHAVVDVRVGELANAPVRGNERCDNSVGDLAVHLPLAGDALVSVGERRVQSPLDKLKRHRPRLAREEGAIQPPREGAGLDRARSDIDFFSGLDRRQERKSANSILNNVLTHIDD